MSGRQEMTQSETRSFEHTVVSVVNCKVGPNELDAWRSRWEEIAREAEATEGCTYFRLAQNTREDNGYAAITAWHPGDRWLAFMQRIPELQEIQSNVWSTPLQFYVLMEPGQNPSW